MKLRGAINAFVILLFSLLYSPVVFGETTKGVWDKNAASVGVFGHSETWDYRVDRLNKKGKSEAFLFLPKHAVPDNITVIFWFHGCSGYSDRTFDVRLALQLKRLDKQKHSYALVVPELHWSKNTKTTCSRQGRSFRKSGELVSFVNESLGKINKALELSGKEKVHNPRIVLIGHSAGGSVIKAASVSGDLCKIAPSDVVWSDSTYGYWFDSAWKNCLSSGKSNVIVLIRKWTKTWDNFRRFIRNKKPYDFLKIKIYTGKVYHRTIGDNAIQFSEIFPEGC